MASASPFLDWIPVLNAIIIIFVAAYAVMSVRESLVRFNVMLDKIDGKLAGYEEKLEEHDSRLVRIETTCQLLHNLRPTEPPHPFQSPSSTPNRV